MTTDKNLIAKLSSEYFRYLIIGILSNVISYILFKILVYFGFTIGIASAFGMILGIINTYTLSRFYMKEAKVDHSNKRLALFGTYYAVMVVLTSSFIQFISHFSVIGENLGWLIGTIGASVCNFLFLSFISLKN